MRYDFVAIGASWGGLDAIKVILGALPPSFPLPVAIVQHRAKDSHDAGLAAYYDARCSLPVGTIEDKQPIEQGHVYFAPPDYHLLVESGHFELSADLPIQFSRPSVDVLFEAAADSYGSGTIGVVLTGTNEDGAAGLQAIKSAGGFTIVQDPATAVRSSMPAAAIAAVGRPDLVGPVEDIGPYLTKLAGQGE